MIDISKCVYEETHYSDEATTHYFVCPKEWLNEHEFYLEEDYGNVVSTCLAFFYNEDTAYLMLSPTVDDNDMLFDVDWRDLYYGEDYDEELLDELEGLVQLKEGEHYHV